MIRSLIIAAGLFLAGYSPVVVPVSFDSEQQCLAANMYFEARGEGTAGQLAVAQVTLNRVASERFPNSICAVVRDAKVRNGKIVKYGCQFTWYCDGLPEVIRDTDTYDKIYDIATNLLLNDAIPDITDGALYFHSKDVSPGWRKKRTVIIGHHIFYA